MPVSDCIRARRACRGGAVRLPVWLTLVTALIAIAAGAAPAVAQADSGSCRGYDVRVTALVVPARMHGTLCVPISGGSASTVMVLVPGGTYNHRYWDFPYRPQTYNFRERMNAAGYATFVVDRLGTGDSSRPRSAIVTAAVQAGAVHDVIQALRDGRIGAFPKVILGGHSLGSMVAVLEAATYNDENAVLLTGFSHHPSVGDLADLFAQSFYPADMDPKFAGKGYDPGYLTTRPGTRFADVYAPETTDPNVVRVDEATKDVFSTAEAGDGLGVSTISPYSGLIKSPVLIADGQKDRVFCDAITDNCASPTALKSSENRFFAGSPCLETYLLSGAGHDINLATDAPTYQQRERSWADAFVGAGSNMVTPPRCGT